ncbi:MAG: mycothiol-dependent nitroreductase Rv2466c family protein [Acidimicrobiales bacterium]
MADLEFYFDPICPFAWMTSKWVREVARQRSYDVEWRFISLRLVNAAVDYDTHFPAGYERGHSAGLELLRVAAAVRNDHGGQAVGALYAAYGAEIFDSAPGRQADLQRDPKGFVSPILERLGLPVGLKDAVSETSFDTEIRSETDRALALTGRDVGTPILHFEPPEGTALFGPVISRLPSPDDALALWNHVVALARFGGFAELKRSLRETPQLRAFGVEEGQVGAEEDWQQGHRRDAVGS